MAAAPISPTAIAAANAGQYAAGQTPAQIAAANQGATSGVGSPDPTVQAPSAIDASSLTQSASPMDTSGYSVGTSGYQPIDTSAILNAFAQPSAEEQTAMNAENATLGGMGKVEAQLGQEGAAQLKLNDQYGVNTAIGTIQKLNSQLAALKAKQNISDNYVQGLIQPLSLTTTQEDAVARQLSSQTASLSAALTAATGDLTVAQNQVQQALQAEFDPLTSELDYYKQMLTVNQANLSKAQSDKATALSAQLQQADTILQNQMAMRNSAMQAMLKYAPYISGMPNGAQILSAMSQASDPSQVALIAGQNGVQLPVPGRYAVSVLTQKDAYGGQTSVPYIYDTTTGQPVGREGENGFTAAGLNAGSGAGTYAAPMGGSGSGASQGSTSSMPFVPGDAKASPTATNQYGVSFASNGLLANTNFNPNAPGDAGTRDQLAAQYITDYLHGNSVPSMRNAMGFQGTSQAWGQVVSRANELFMQATGHSLSGIDPSTIQNQRKIIQTNQDMISKFQQQEGAIASNFGLSLQNLNANNVNKSIPIINGLVNAIRTGFGDPSTAQYSSQLSTLQNELASLVAIKNAGGTTVADKIMSGNLLDGNLTPTQAKQVIQTLLQEGRNNIKAVNDNSQTYYNQIDPLMQDPNNPAVYQVMNSAAQNAGTQNKTNNTGLVNKLLTAKGISYNSLISQMQAAQQANPSQYQGMQPAIDLQGNPVFASPEEILSGQYIPL